MERTGKIEMVSMYKIYIEKRGWEHQKHPMPFATGTEQWRIEF